MRKSDVMQTRDPYEDLLERARKLAAEKRADGVPEETTEALDQLFLEVAPTGARVEANGVEALIEMLALYDFDPNIEVESTRKGLAPVVRLVKRVLRPMTAWQLRHVTDQLNAYKTVQAEVLRTLVRRMGERDQR